MKRLSINTLAYCLIGTLFLFSCTDEDKTASSGDGVAVSFSLSGIGRQPTSRATAGKLLADGTTVRVLAYHRPDGITSAALSAVNYAGEATYVISGGGTTLTPCTVDDEGAVTSTSGQPMQLLVGAYDFFTVTPALAATHTGDAPVVSVANGTDYAFSTTGSQVIASAGENRGQTVTLERLNRQCARLNFTIRCDETVNTITGIKVEELKLTGLSDTPLQTAATTEQAGVIPPSGSSTLTLNGTDLPTGAANAKQATGSVIVLPKANASLGLSMQLCFNGSILPTVFDEVTVPAMTFEAGREYPLTITLSHGGAVKLEIGSALPWGDGGDHDQHAGLLPGITVGMPDWTLDVQNQGLGTVPNLSREGTANCYLIANDADKYYGFDATVMGNGATTEAATQGGTASGARIVPQALSPQSVKVLWETGSVAGAVVSKVQLYADKTKVLFKTGAAAGNAVIAVYDGADGTGNILWSWHIWKPETEVTDFRYQKYVDNTGVVTTADNYRMLDRNLGATTAAVGANGALGLFYQWGRKDPFPGAKEKNINEYMATVPALASGNRLSNVENPSILSLADNAACLAYAIENPTTFLKGVRGWSEGWIKEKQDNLWGNPWEGGQTVYSSGSKTVNSGVGRKSIYDPCPVGYRVAPQDTWTALKKGDGGNYNDVNSRWDDSAKGWSSTSMSPTGSAVFFPASGYVGYGDSYGYLGSVGRDGFYWASSPDHESSYYAGEFYFNDYGNLNPVDGGYRASGGPVRCVAELD